ncbi:hypothetical protein [Glycomyces rhizosphaerae]|uniref:Uncharacterized protein n=1 Tax=Glycomyces rhizosphaerae TaxID=2054422 RepID=A0ABV7Q6B0_9ACTN
MTQYESKTKGRKQHEPGLELSIGQVLAATGATVLGAVLAKLLGLWGTLAGTAVLSVCSSIGAVLILRAIRSTGEKIKEQITALAPIARGKASAASVETSTATVESSTVVNGKVESVTATAKIPDTEQLRALNADTVVLADTDEIVVPADPAPEGHITKTSSRKRTLVAILISSVLVFGITIGTLYLLGTFTGDPERFISDNPQMIVNEVPVETDTAEDATSEAPGESAPPSESATEETPSESTSPTESATSETPSEAPSTDTSSGGSEETVSPTPEDEAVTESPSAE